MQKQPSGIAPYIVNIFITLCIGGVASFFTVSQINSWYVYLHKPTFNPPNWLFGPVWTVLYIVIGIAAGMVWQRRQQAVQFKAARNIYLLQLLLNFSWSIVFFGMHQILGALVVIVALLICIIVNIMAFSKISKPAAWLFVPYLAWVSFATLLNLSIYLLNK
jgi:tryptophan-rich sensory protein